MKLLPDCQEVSRLLSDGQDRRLPVKQRAQLRLHLVMCDTCRNVEGQMEFLRRAVRELGRREPPER